MTQGKCDECKRAFRWTAKVLLRNAYCPDDGHKLQATTHLYRRGPWQDISSPIVGLVAGMRQIRRYERERAS